MLAIGLMSGTSMDGIDAALIESDGSASLLREIEDCSMDYAVEFKRLLKAAEYAIRHSQGDLQQAADSFETLLMQYLQNELAIASPTAAIDNLVSYISSQGYTDLNLANIVHHSTLLHAKITQQLIQQSGYQSSQIDVVGYHGQTMYHQPQRQVSIILGDGQLLANTLGITVINDFRSNDIAHGGQGAPFAPLYHFALAQRDSKVPLAVVNCGGISNVTIIPNDDENAILGFDTGPGNALIDSLIRQRTHGKHNMDTDGHYGLAGSVQTSMMDLLYQHCIIKNGVNFFELPPPKSLDYGDMQLIPELDELSIEDACATLEAFTADSIIHSINQLNITLPTHWVVAGGGWKNPVIFNQFQRRLQQQLNRAEVYHADDINWNGQALEAQIFAYLAVRSLQGKHLSLPSTTQVAKAVTGGQRFNPD